MILSLVVAMAENNVIGKNGTMPWHLPADLRHFRAVTTGKSVIMGRKTYESIGKPLPNRRNLVISRTPDFSALGCEVVTSLDQALQACAGEAEVMIIGGGQIYAEALPRAQRIYLTRIQARIEGDTTFPDLTPSQWREVKRTMTPPDGKNAYACAFTVLERVTG